MKAKEARQVLWTLREGAVTWLNANDYAYHVQGKNYRLVDVAYKWGWHTFAPQMYKRIVQREIRTTFDISEIRLYMLLRCSDPYHKLEGAIWEILPPHKWREREEKLSAFRDYLSNLQSALLIDYEANAREALSLLARTNFRNLQEYIDSIDESLNGAYWTPTGKGQYVN